MDFAILLTTKAGADRPSPDDVRAHVLALRGLEDEGRLIAAGPLGDGSGGLVLARFPDADAAERYASSDAFVRCGRSSYRVVPWEPSHASNGHIGVLEPAPRSPFLHALRARATARAFSDRPLTREMLEPLLEAAASAPSEFNLQPWRAIVCLDADARGRLQQVCLNQEHVGRAAAAIVVTGSTRVLVDDAPRAVDVQIAAGRWPVEEREGRIAFVRSCYADPERARASALRNAVIFGHQLLLGALSSGLAGFWLGGVDEAALRAEFGIADEAVLAGVIGLGWPADTPMLPLPRAPLDVLVRWHD